MSQPILNEFLNEFLEYLDSEDKEKCVEIIMQKLDNKELDISTLYSQILEPALNRFYCDVEEEKLCIWKEHIRTSIIRAIIEICYPYILKERKEQKIKVLNIKVLIGCPSEEYHDVGARMIADMFTLYGYDSIFVGANTPRTEIRDAINILKPKIIALSITNYYNLVEAEKAIALIKNYTEFKGKIIVGGIAFLSNPEIYKKIGADFLIENYSQIKNLAEGI